MNDSRPTNSAVDSESTTLNVDFQNRFALIKDSFIPLRHGELIQRLVLTCSLKPDEKREFAQLSDRLASIFHIESLQELLRIEEIYDWLDPDADIRLIRRTGAQAEEISGEFFRSLSSLLKNAHYQKLTRSQIQSAVKVGSQWGVKLEVDYEMFDQIEVFVRGYRESHFSRRSWRKLFRKETVRFSVFRRLVVAFRVKQEQSESLPPALRTESVYLKYFRDIPETDLEILLPGAKVRLSLIDRGKILIPTISGIALTSYKIVRAAAVLTLATLAGVWGWVLLIGALTAYVVRSILGFVRTKDKYQFDLTRNLYLKNLDNNAGVLYRIFNEAEEQELCEAIMGYSLLLEHGGSEGITIETLDQFAESFLFDLTGERVQFDQDDAMYKLARLELAHCDAAGRWRAIPLNEASRVLSRKWPELYDLQLRRRQQG
jgi:hypothetical protein